MKCLECIYFDKQQMAKMFTGHICKLGVVKEENCENFEKETEENTDGIWKCTSI